MESKAPVVRLPGKKLGGGGPQRGEPGAAVSQGDGDEERADAVSAGVFGLSDQLCGCGCGRRTNLATRTYNRDGIKRGTPMRFLPRHQFRVLPKSGPDNPNWQGGRIVLQAGYVMVKQPTHPHANRAGYVREHILIVEEALGRRLPPSAQVHHVNSQKADNRRENLVVCQDQTYHSLLHLRQRALRACGHPDWRRCRFCQTWSPLENMVPNGKHSMVHRACRNADNAAREPLRKKPRR